jgi:SHS2 domain-containing protein
MKTQDFWLRGQGADLNGAFTGLSHELVRQVCPPVSAGQQQKPLDLICHGGDHRSLLLSWIETLLYVLDVRHVILSDFEVNVSLGLLLTARCMTQPILGGHLRLPQGLDATTAAVIHTQDGQWRLETKLILPDACRQI